jgi:hypothetical protein
MGTIADARGRSAGDWRTISKRFAKHWRGRERSLGVPCFGCAVSRNRVPVFDCAESLALFRARHNLSFSCLFFGAVPITFQYVNINSRILSPSPFPVPFSAKRKASRARKLSHTLPFSAIMERERAAEKIDWRRLHIYYCRLGRDGE